MLLKLELIQIIYFFLGYFEGIVANLDLIPVYYPGWIMRLYHDIHTDDPVMKVWKSYIKIEKF